MFVYKEYKDDQPYGEEIEELYKNRKDARTRLRQRVENHFGVPWDMVRESVGFTKDDIFTADYVTCYDEGRKSTLHWLIKNIAVHKTGDVPLNGEHIDRFKEACYHANIFVWLIQCGYTLKDLALVLCDLATDDLREDPLAELLPLDELTEQVLARFDESGMDGYSNHTYPTRDEFFHDYFYDKKYMERLLSMMPEPKRAKNTWQTLYNRKVEEILKGSKEERESTKH